MYSYCCTCSCAGGEWVSCDKVQLGFELYRGSYQWDDKPNFNINHRSTGNVTVSLGITIKGVHVHTDTYVSIRIALCMMYSTIFIQYIDLYC